MNLRRATILDWPTLLAWRNDTLTVFQSCTQGAVSLQDHIAWLKTRTENNAPGCPWIAEVYREPVGTIRNDGGELSWTIAPEYRQHGLGAMMVAEFVRCYPGHYRAEIKRGNFASLRIAEACGIEVRLLVDGH